MKKTRDDEARQCKVRRQQCDMRSNERRDLRSDDDEHINNDKHEQGMKQTLNPNVNRNKHLCVVLDFFKNSLT